MNEYLLFLVLGIGTGALYAALAQGVLVAYRGSGVVNLAQGAVAMYGAYTYYELHRAGRLFLPPIPNPLSLLEGVTAWFGADLSLPDIPTFVGIGGGSMPVVPALVLSLAVAAALGYAMHALVYRPLRTAPPLAKTVAGVGVIIVLQSTIGLRFGSDARSAESILPDQPIHMLGGIVKADRLWLAVIVVAAGIGLWALFRFTVFGLAARAAAGNEKGAVLLGYSPDRLAARSWVLSSVLSAAVGILAAPFVTLSPTTLTLLVIPAIGAVLLARFESVAVATIAAIALGMVDQLLILLLRKPQFGWLPSNGSRELLPLLVIVAALFARGRSLPVRGSTEIERLPRAPETRRPVRLVAVLAVVFVVGQLTLGYEWRQALTVSAIGTVIALSLVVVTGLVGQISLCQMAVAGCGAFFLTRSAGDWGIPFPLAPILAAGVATVIGLVVAVPAVRIRGVNLALVTLSFAYAVDQLVFNNDDLVGSSADAVPAPSPSLLGYKFGPLDQLDDRGVPSVPFGIFAGVVMIVAVVAVVNLRRSNVGRSMLAVRANERAAASVGIDHVRTKLLAFALASFLAGIAGSLLAYQNSGRVEPTTFAVMTSLSALAIAYLGGISSVGGAITAGVLVAGGLSSTVLDKVMHMGETEQLATGALLIVTAIANPEGIAAALRHTGGVIRHLAGRRRTPAPVVEATATLWATWRARASRSTSLPGGPSGG
uniref:ABC transporter permease n=2 Tax=Desertimonas flava TaxID=2064846 RepID=UPI0023F51587